jgi:16S rRNA (guanine527-N7)-methyltransferase
VAAWAPRFDLVAPGDIARFRTRHTNDCLRLLPLVDGLGDGNAIDVGSGAGLPGLVLAIARPDREWLLLEPRQKRAGFLEEAVRELELPNVGVLPITAERAATRPALAQGHIFAVARALASPQRSLDLLRPLVAPGGTAAIFVGKTGETPREAKEWEPGICISSPSAGSGGWK